LWCWWRAGVRFLRVEIVGVGLRIGIENQFWYKFLVFKFGRKIQTSPKNLNLVEKFKFGRKIQIWPKNSNLVEKIENWKKNNPILANPNPKITYKPTRSTYNSPKFTKKKVYLRIAQQIIPNHHHNEQVEEEN